jgi:hypothetical protein
MSFPWGLPMKKTGDKQLEGSGDRKETKKKGNQKAPRIKEPRTKLPEEFSAPKKYNVFVLSDKEWEQLKLRRNFDKGQLLKNLDRNMIERQVNGFCLAVTSGLSRKNLKSSLTKITMSMAKIKKSVDDLKAMTAINKQFLIENIFGTGFTKYEVGPEMFEAYDIIDQAFAGCLKSLASGKTGSKESFLVTLIESLAHDLMMFSENRDFKRSKNVYQSIGPDNASNKLRNDTDFLNYLFELISDRTGIEFKKTSIDDAFKTVISNRIKDQIKKSEQRQLI